jgi:putative ABC transport system substrate-binding protein
VHRRAFLSTMAGSLLAAPLASEAQRGAKVWRIGVLETTSVGANATNLAAFRQALAELGYAEGRNIVFEYRFAEGAPERFKDLAAELVRLKVDLILTRGTPAVLAAMAATKTIPVVMAASGDPILSGVGTHPPMGRGRLVKPRPREANRRSIPEVALTQNWHNFEFRTAQSAPCLLNKCLI